MEPKATASSAAERETDPQSAAKPAVGKESRGGRPKGSRIRPKAAAGPASAQASKKQGKRRSARKE